MNPRREDGVDFEALPAQPRSTARLTRIFLGAYPRRTAWLCLGLLVAGLLEGVGVSMFLPLLDLILNPGAASESPLGALVSRTFGALGLAPTLPSLLGALVSAMSLKALFQWLAMRQAGYTLSRVSTDLRLAVFRNLIDAAWGWIARKPAGAFAATLANETRLAAAAYQSTAQAIASATQVAVYTALAFLVSWKVALLAGVAGAVLSVIILPFLRMGRKAGQRQVELVKSITSRFLDAMHGIKPVKAMGRDHLVLPLLERETRELDDAQRDQVLTVETVRALQEPVTMAILALGMWAAVTWLREPFPVLLMQAFLFNRLAAQLNATLTHVQGVTLREGSFWNVIETIQEAGRAREPAGGSAAAPRLERELLFQDVALGHGRTTLYEGVNLSLPAGAFAVVLGPSGAGKTTLIDAIAGLVPPMAGSLRVDGVPLADSSLRAWRELIGYVPQEMLAFHDSVRNNVTLGDPRLTDDDVWSALRLAGAEEVVRALPDGLDTSLGERGSRLSGGQRQRLGLARALVRRPRLLILDEVTTALDPETEQALCAQLSALAGSTTILAITHQAALRRVATHEIRLEPEERRVTVRER